MPNRRTNQWGALSTPRSAWSTVPTPIGIKSGRGQAAKALRFSIGRIQVLLRLPRRVKMETVRIQLAKRKSSLPVNNGTAGDGALH